jgi:hypothetical protein
LAVSGGTAVVGALGRNSYAGAVYVFQVPSGPGPTFAVSVLSNPPGRSFTLS